MVDGWDAVASGLLTYLPHAIVQLEGSLGRIEEAAWGLIGLGIALDATLWIQEMRGGDRARLDKQGWTGIDGFRRAAGAFRDGSPFRDTQKGPGTSSGKESL